MSHYVTVYIYASRDAWTHHKFEDYFRYDMSNRKESADARREIVEHLLAGKILVSIPETAV